MSLGPATGVPPSGLEQFVRDYVESLGGAWEEIEPQVYDLLLPAVGESADAAEEPERGLVRVTFDPEALPEHPRSQLASFGTPLIDRMLGGAVCRGGYVEAYLTGLNLAPHNLAGRVVRGLSLPDGSLLNWGRVRALHFRQLLLWFQATFISDQKEQEILPVAIDLHYGREVRHWDRLLDRARLSSACGVGLPDAPDGGRTAAYRLARDEAVRTLSSLANARARELAARLERQVARMTTYYEDLNRELDEQAARGRGREAADEKLTARREALRREREQRIAELRQKCSLRVELRLLHALLLRQPKLLLRGRVELNRAAGDLEMVWDPLTESLEAWACPVCGRPTFEPCFRRAGGLSCALCAAEAPAAKRTPR